MKKRIELDPTYKINKTKEICAIFLEKILDQPEALVTDSSLLCDFSPINDIEYSVGPGSKPGFYKFEQKFFRGGINHPDFRNRSKWSLHEWEAEGVHWRRSIIEKTRLVFGVDISTVFDLNLCEIILYIVENYVPKN